MILLKKVDETPKYVKKFYFTSFLRPEISADSVIIIINKHNRHKFMGMHFAELNSVEGEAANFHCIPCDKWFLISSCRYFSGNFGNVRLGSSNKAEKAKGKPDNCVGGEREQLHH